MILINWYRVNWLFWDWIFIFALIVVVIFLRSMRRIFRWKRLQIHNIEKMKINIQGLNHEAIVYQQKEYANDPDKIQTYIAVFSSVFGSKRTMDAFCQSLCVYFNRVVLINSKKIMKELSLTSASSPFSQHLRPLQSNIYLISLIIKILEILLHLTDPPLLLIRFCNILIIKTINSTLST